MLSKLQKKKIQNLFAWQIANQCFDWNLDGNKEITHLYEWILSCTNTTNVFAPGLEEI